MKRVLISFILCCGIFFPLRPSGYNTNKHLLRLGCEAFAAADLKQRHPKHIKRLFCDQKTHDDSESLLKWARSNMTAYSSVFPDTPAGNFVSYFVLKIENKGAEGKRYLRHSADNGFMYALEEIVQLTDVCDQQCVDDMCWYIMQGGSVDRLLERHRKSDAFGKVVVDGIHNNEKWVRPLLKGLKDNKVVRKAVIDGARNNEEWTVPFLVESGVGYVGASGPSDDAITKAAVDNGRYTYRKDSPFGLYVQAKKIPKKEVDDRARRDAAFLLSAQKGYAPAMPFAVALHRKKRSFLGNVFAHRWVKKYLDLPPEQKSDDNEMVCKGIKKSATRALNAASAVDNIALNKKTHALLAVALLLASLGRVRSQKRLEKLQKQLDEFQGLLRDKKTLSFRVRSLSKTIQSEKRWQSLLKVLQRGSGLTLLATLAWSFATRNQ